MSLKEKAERLFRIECIETLSWPPCSSLPNTITRQNPSIYIHDVSRNLDSILKPLEPSTSICPEIDDHGNIIGFSEETRASSEFGSASVSMSINRAPIVKHDKSVMSSIRGSSSSVPFMPGFLEQEEESDLNKLLEENNEGESINDEIKFLNFDSLENPALLNDVPVLGTVRFAVTDAARNIENKNKEVESIDLDSVDMFDLIDFVSSAAPITVPEKTKIEEKLEEKSQILEEPIDSKELDTIEECMSTSIVAKDCTPQPPNGKFVYANKVEMSEADFEEYKQLVPTMVRKYPFTLDPFQQASVLCMEHGVSLFVAAHTSAGKTAVAEYAIALCKAHKTRAIYTSPIKALSNQKFRDLKLIFDDVGLVTGDIQINTDAFCLIMTTEILRSMLYNGSDVIRDLEWVVFDEVHYINNEGRGHVWEEVLIMLPSHVKIVMLSATVPNCLEFADWVGRIKNRRINVISTYQRPVPLEHYLYTGQDGKTQKDLFKIIDRNGEFLMKGYNDAKEAKEKIYDKKPAETGQAQGRGGFRGRHNGGGQGRGKEIHRNWPGKNDKNIYLNLIYYMKNTNQLPMVAFVFSRKRCDENAQLLMSMDLTSEVEKSHVHKFFGQCIERLKGSDKELPQVLRMRELCLRGFAVHHSGILPILKEVVELLFQKGYVKILFATETFAMGVNMPARCVVFDNIVKHDGTMKRILNPGEYTQMAGRAGRRGLDSTGSVIVLCKESTIPAHAELQNLMSGSALKLESKFRVTYSMLLNLLRVEQLRIEDMLQRSYVESDSLRESRDRKKKLKDINDQLQNMSMTECEICKPEGNIAGLRTYHDTLSEFISRTAEIWPKLNAREAYVSKLLTPGRYLVVSNIQNALQNEVVVLLKELVSGNEKSLQVLVGEKDSDEAYSKEAQCKEFLKMSKRETNWLSEENSMLGIARFGTKSTRNSHHEVSYFRVCDVPISSIVTIVKKAVKTVATAEVLQEYQLKQLPRFRKQPVSETVTKILHQMADVGVGLAKGELEVYTMENIANNCADVELNYEASAVAILEMSLNDTSTYPARYCTRFESHFATLRKRVQIERTAETLKYELSSDALLLSEEYRNRLRVLEQLGFVGADKTVSLKGRVACEIHHQELFITELILDNKFHTRPVAELAALLSTLTCQYNSGKNMNFKKDSCFWEIWENVTNVMARLEMVAARCGAQIAEIGCEIRYDLMEVVYHWASGMPFSMIMELTDAQEGLIVACIRRLDEVCKDVRNAGRIVGHPALVEKMEEVSASIRRDIVFAASLYTSV